MADTDALRPYRQSTFPTLDGGDRPYLNKELRKIENAIAALGTVAARLEERILALEP